MESLRARSELGITRRYWLGDRQAKANTLSPQKDEETPLWPVGGLGWQRLKMYPSVRVALSDEL